eukprot:291229_1
MGTKVEGVERQKGADPKCAVIDGEMGKNEEEPIGRCPVRHHVQHRAKAGTLLQMPCSGAVCCIQDVAQGVAEEEDDGVLERDAKGNRREDNPEVPDQVGYIEPNRVHRWSRSHPKKEREKERENP